MKTSHSFHRRNRLTWAQTFLSVLALVCAAALLVSAQSVAFSPNQGESDGVSAGGKWMEFHSEDKMTGAKKVRFELLSDNYLREDPDYKPRIQFVCTNGKYIAADFNPGIRLGPPNRPGFWGQPQMEVMVRVDDTHSYHGWNWIRNRFLSMDKGTTSRTGRGSHLQGANPRPQRTGNRGIFPRWPGSRTGKTGLRLDPEKAEQGLRPLLAGAITPASGHIEPHESLNVGNRHKCHRPNDRARSPAGSGNRALPGESTVSK